MDEAVTRLVNAAKYHMTPSFVMDICMRDKEKAAAWSKSFQEIRDAIAAIELQDKK